MQGPVIVYTDWARGHTRILKAIFEDLGTGLREGDIGVKEDVFHWMRRFSESVAPSHCMHTRAAAALSAAFFVVDQSDLAAWKTSPDYQQGPVPAGRARYYSAAQEQLHQVGGGISGHGGPRHQHLPVHAGDAQAGQGDIDAWRLSGEQQCRAEHGMAPSTRLCGRWVNSLLILSFLHATACRCHGGLAGRHQPPRQPACEHAV